MALVTARSQWPPGKTHCPALCISEKGACEVPALVSMRWRSSRCVPWRMSRFRTSSTLMAAWSTAKGSISFPEHHDP